MTTAAHASINRTARLAGGLYLALMPFGFFGMIYVPSVLVVPGDAASTASNIMASEWLIRSGTVSVLISQIVFVFLVLALYRLLKPVNESHAMLMGVLALPAVPIAFLNEVNHVAVLRLLSSADQGAYSANQLHALVMLFLEMREGGILFALVFWGLWLLPLGLLVFRSGFLPKLLGVLLVIGGVGYLLDVGAQLLFPGASTIGRVTSVFAMLAAMGELLFALWLVIKGVNAVRWQEGVAARSRL